MTHEDDPRATLRSLVAQLDENLADLVRRIAALKGYSEELADRKWAQTLDEGARRVQPRPARLLAALADQPLADLIAELLEFAEDVREIYSATTQEDLGAEIDEVGPDDPAAQPHLQQIDDLFEAGNAAAHLLRSAATNAITSRDYGAQSMPKEMVDATDKAGGAGADNAMLAMIQEAIVSLHDRGAAPPAPTVTGTEVGRRMRATLASLGLPEINDNPAFNERPAELRALVTESLRRHFDYVEHDGVRTYFRTERGLAAASAAGDGRSFAALRGQGLFNAEMLRTAAELVLKLIDELPSLSPRYPNLTRLNAEGLRDRIRTILDDIVELASAPLGALAAEIKSQFKWLLLAVADWLEAAAIPVSVKLREEALKPVPLTDLSRTEGRSNDRVSAVVTQEVGLRVEALLDALKAIWSIACDPSEDTGRDAGRAEQALVLLGASASQLQRELDRLGTSPEEQEITFFGVKGSDEVSIAQFVRWAINISATFAASPDSAARLRPPELQVLQQELGAIADMAGELSKMADEAPPRIQLAGARRQLQEVRDLIHEAERNVERLSGPAKTPAKAAS